jgi:hypothetical protein
MKLLWLVAAILASGCSHTGSLVTTEKDAWISVESATKATLYYCVAEIKEQPVCYSPTYMPPRPATPRD